MNFIEKNVEAYALAHSRQPSSLAQKMEVWTYANREEDARMLSGAMQAAVLQLLVRASNAKRILEIGMFTGYSALTMAEVLPEDGQLITLDIDLEMKKVAQAFFDQSPHGRKISIVIGPALETISKLDGNFDLVYIDADKENYLNYYDAVLPLIKTGGILVADNVLWSSTVLNPETESAIELDKFNKRVCSDDRVSNAILTIRDGLMVAYKK